MLAQMNCGTKVHSAPYFIDITKFQREVRFWVIWPAYFTTFMHRVSSIYGITT